MQEVQEMFQKGIDLQQRGLFDHAIEEYERALNLDPDNIDIMLNLGAACLQKGLAEKSIKFLTRVLQRDSQNTLALYNIGKAFVYKDDPETALEAFYRAGEILPEDVEIKKSVASCYRTLERYSEAVELSMSYFDSISGDYAAVIELAENLICLERYDEALDMFRRAASIACDSTEPLMGIFKCQRRLGNKDKATTTLRRAIMLEPENQSFLVQLIDLLIEDGRIQDAVEALKNGIENIAEPLLLQEKYNEMVRRLPILKKRSDAASLVVKNSPYETDVYDILDGLYDGKLRFDVAVKELETLRQRDPEDLFIADELANLLFQARQFDQASEIYSQIYASNPSNPIHRVDLAKSLAMKGDLEAARAILTDSLRELGHLPELNLAMTELDLFEKDFAKAAGRLQIILKEFPEESHARFLQAYTLLHLDHIEEAQEVFEKLLEESEPDEELVLWYSRLSILTGTPEKALALWDKFDDGIESLVEIVTRTELTVAGGDGRGVMQHLKRIGEYHPRFIEDHMLFGKAFFYAGEFANAQREFDLVLKHEAKNAEALAMSAINCLIRNKAAKFWNYWQHALDCDSLMAVVPAMALKNSFNFSQKERLKAETKKMITISSLKNEDKSRMMRLLKNLA